MNQYLRYFTKNQAISVEPSQLPSPWNICNQVIKNYQKNKLNELQMVYDQSQAELKSSSSAWVLVTLYVILAKILLGVEQISLDLLNRKWRDLHIREKEHLYDLMCEVQMEVSLHQDIVENSVKIHRQYFDTGTVKVINPNLMMMKSLYYQSAINSRIGKMDEAEKLLKRALNNAIGQRWELKIINLLATIYGKQGKISKAMSTLVEVLDRSNSADFSYARALAFNKLSIIANIRGDKKQAEIYSDYCIDICKKYTFGKLHLTILYNQATILFSSGKYHDAMIVYQFLASEHRKLGNYQKYGTVLIAIGAIHGRIGEYNQALQALKSIDGLKEYLSHSLWLTKRLNYVDILIQLGNWSEVRNEIRQLTPIIEQTGSTELKAFFITTKLKSDLYGGLIRPNHDELEHIINYLTEESNFELLAKIKFYLATMKEMSGDLYRADQLLSEAIVHGKHTNHPTMLAEFLFYRIGLLRDTTHSDEILELLDELRDLQNTYPYAIVQDYYLVAEFISSYHLDNQKTNPKQFRYLLNNIIRNNQCNHKILQYLLVHLLELIVETSDGFLFNYKEEIISMLGDIADEHGSRYLQSTVYLAEARLAIKEEDHEQASTYLLHAKDLALQGGFSHKLDHITYYELMLSQVNA